MDANLRSVELGNDIRGQLGEIVQCYDERLARQEIGLVDRYLRNDVSFCFCPLRNQAQYGFIVYADKVGDRSKPADLHSSVSGHCGDLKSSGPNRNLDQSFMFAQDVEAMEGPQNRIASFIRFQLFDESALGSGQPLYKFYSLVSSRREHVLGDGDGEINIFGVRYAVAVGQRRREDVETAAKDVNIDSSFDAERERQWFFCERYKNIVRNVRIRITNSGFDMCIEPGLCALMEGWELGFGPINASLSR